MYTYNLKVSCFLFVGDIRYLRRHFLSKSQILKNRNLSMTSSWRLLIISKCPSKPGNKTLKVQCLQQCKTLIFLKGKLFIFNFIHFSSSYFRIKPDNSVWFEDAKLKNLIICQPENRNRFNKIFGGFIMRQAFELAWANTYTFR